MGTNLASSNHPVKKTSTNMSLSLASSRVMVGDNIHADGKLSTTRGWSKNALSNAQVTLSVILPNGSTTIPAQGGMILTKTDGTFSMDFVPSAAGAHQFKAYYAGDATHSPSSKSVSFIADSPPDPLPEIATSTISLTAASNQVLAGQAIRADGLITSRSSSGSGPIAGAQISLSVTLPDGSSSAPKQGSIVTSGSDGTFSIEFVSDVAGKYSFIANYAGDQSHSSASQVINVTVTPVAPPLGPTEYAGVVYQTFTTASYSVSAINAALVNCPSGQAVKLAAGTYLINGIINVPAGKKLVGSTDGAGGIGTIITTTLTGSGVQNSGYINIGAGMNTVMNIKTLCGYYFSGLNSHDFLIQDCEYNGPTDSTAGLYYLCGFFIYIGANGNYDNGNFVRCIAKNAPCFGFLVAADGTKNSNKVGGIAYSAHSWSWTSCEAYGCGIANMNYPNYFVYGCGYDFFEGFGLQDDVVGMRVTNCIANGNAADGFHIEYMMDISDFAFANCTANDNGQWFKTGHTIDPPSGVLIGTGFYLGGAVISQTKVINCMAQNNWGYSTRGGGYGMVDSQMHTDLDGTYVQGSGAA